MIKLDHFTIFVSNYAASREWYVNCLGLHVAFESLKGGVAGLEDDAGVELILVQRAPQSGEKPCALTFQCESVQEKYRELSARGIRFVHPPMDVSWGFGAELQDPDGYLVRLWDKHTMPGYEEK